MKNKFYCLGIDTSNYTTSAAIVDEELNIVSESREILKVRQGERGLRQSQALFEHIGNLPHILEKSLSFIPVNKLTPLTCLEYLFSAP